VSTALKWHRAEAGHYYALRSQGLGKLSDRLDIVQVGGNWILRLNGQHKGYFGRLSDAKARAIEVR